MSKIRLAIIGCGSMEETHESGFAAVRDRVDIVATVDPVIERAESAAVAYGAKHAVADFMSVIDEFDAALVVTPHDTHHSIGMTLLQHGKHVLMEKPLANSEAECLEMIHEAERRNLHLVVAYPMRYHPLVVSMKNEMDAGRIGDVFQVSIWTEQFTKREEGHWINSSASLGGGQFFSHGCHYIDMLLWMLGRPVEGSHIGTRLGTDWMEGEGTSNVAIKFESGALGYHFGTWGARGTKNGYEFHAHGTEGLLVLDFEGSTLKLYSGNTVELLQEHRGSTKHVEGELLHFLDCIEGAAEPLTDAPTSLQGLRVIWRLYEAERTGRVADLSGLSFEDPWDALGLAALPVQERVDA